ncbi:MAG: glycosyltransferase family 4 protein [Planctomycetota bacterium]
MSDSPAEQRGEAPRAKVVLIGGPDVDARLPLVHRLAPEFDVTVFGASSMLAETFAQHGVSFRAYPLDRRLAPFSDVRTVRALTKLLRELRPDLVHAFDTKPGVFGCIAAQRAGVPSSVCTVTGLGSLYSAGGIKTALLRRVYEWLQRAASRRAARTVFQNHDDLRQLVAAGVVAPERATVILGSGVDTAHFAPARVAPGRRQELRAELGLPVDAVVVTMIARVTRTKGVLEFADAARAVRATRAGVRFLLVGPDDEGSRDRLRPEELQQLRQAVTWPGARADIVDVLAATDVFVLPTAYREGIPRVLLEAASMGLPMVTTDSPGCNEAVAAGENGLLIGSADPAALAMAVARLCDDPALRGRFGAASRRRAESLFDLGRVAERTRALYCELLAGHASSSRRSPVQNSASR